MYVPRAFSPSRSLARFVHAHLLVATLWCGPRSKHAGFGYEAWPSVRVSVRRRKGPQMVGHSLPRLLTSGNIRLGFVWPVGSGNGSSTIPQTNVCAYPVFEVVRRWLVCLVVFLPKKRAGGRIMTSVCSANAHVFVPYVTPFGQVCVLGVGLYKVSGPCLVWTPAFPRCLAPNAPMCQ